MLEVRAGERLDERQALEGLLVASANNIAPILAKWDARSTTAFIAQMNTTAASLGLKHTHFVEPSGLAAGNVGTSIDMMRLCAAALANPTIAAIVRLGEIKLPVAGTVINYDYEIGHHGIIGIKTGSSTAVAGNFVFAARRTLDGRTPTVVGAVLNQEGTSTLETALSAGERLAAAAFTAIRPLTILSSGRTAVRIQAGWASKPILGRTTAPLHYLGLPGTPAKLKTRLAPAFAHNPPHQIRRGERLGSLTATIGAHTYTVPIIATTSLPSPTIRYRLTRL